MQVVCSWVGAALIVAALLPPVAPRQICHDNSYAMNGQYCYRYVQTAADYSAANRTCVRDGRGATLLFIDSEEESTYIWNDIFIAEGGQEFWLGLDDQLKEGDFRWINSSAVPTYTNYSDNFEFQNSPQYDCVKFTAEGWSVVQDFCGSADLPFVCKAAVCESSDGQTCDTAGGGGGGGGLAAGAIAAIVIVIIVVIIVIVVVVLLLCMWKYQNDAFRRYLCCCVGGASRQAMMSLQQENQRLRQELNQSKINSSGRYPQGLFGRESVSGVPDGQGGTLPALKQGHGLPSPFTPQSRSVSTGQPPPLSLQRGLSQVAPLPQTTPTFRSPFTPTPSVFSPQTPTTVGALANQQRVPRQLQRTPGSSLPPLHENQMEEGGREGGEKGDKIIPTGVGVQPKEKEPPLEIEEVKPDEEEEGGGGGREGAGEGAGGGEEGAGEGEGGEGAKREGSESDQTEDS